MSVPSIILASTSKYRRELLQRLIPQFECQAPGVDEDAFHTSDVLPQLLAGILATAKAEVVAASNPMPLSLDQISLWISMVKSLASPARKTER